MLLMKPVQLSESPYGYVCSKESSSSPFLALKDSVHCRLNANNHCLFTIGNTMPCYTSAIMKNDHQVYIFDIHSQDDNGLLWFVGTIWCSLNDT